LIAKHLPKRRRSRPGSGQWLRRGALDSWTGVLASESPTRLAIIAYQKGPRSRKPDFAVTALPSKSKLRALNPITHFLAGWAVANLSDLGKRERTVVVLAGIVPDIDAAGLVAEMLTRNSNHPLYWWSEYHHVLAHNAGFGIVVAGTAFALARQRGKTALLATLSFHLHLLGDLIGARGPGGEQWPIPYLLPFSNGWQLTWSGQWPLNGWPNMVLTALLIGATCRWAWRRGFSPLEMLSARADQVFVEALRRRWPLPSAPV